jgi:hypothetical protein
MIVGDAAGKWAVIGWECVHVCYDNQCVIVGEAVVIELSFFVSSLPPEFQCVSGDEHACEQVTHLSSGNNPGWTYLVFPLCEWVGGWWSWVDMVDSGNLSNF